MQYVCIVLHIRQCDKIHITITHLMAFAIGNFILDGIVEIIQADAVSGVEK